MKRRLFRDGLAGGSLKGVSPAGSRRRRELSDTVAPTGAEPPSVEIARHRRGVPEALLSGPQGKTASRFLPHSKGVRIVVAVTTAILAVDVLSSYPALVDEATGVQIRKVAGLLVVLLSAGLCIARPVRSGVERAAWVCIAGFLIANTLGAGYYVAELAALPYRPAPSWSDAFWFMRYPFLYAGVHLLIRSRTRGFGTAEWVDGAVGVCSMIAVSAILVIEPVLEHVTDPMARAVYLMYPLANVLGLGLLIGIVAQKGLRLQNWLVMAAALIVFAVTDGAYVRHVAFTGQAPFGGLYDAGYLGTLILLAFAAWQPSVREHAEDVPRTASSVLPLVFAGVGLTLLTVPELRDLNTFVIGGAILSLVGVLVRQAIFAHDNRRILARVRREAVTDALTGLPNRRSLMEDLDYRFEEAGPGESFAVALMDLDGFKGYNDAFGHHAGDELLARLAEKLDKAVHGRARGYRLGGDEFCVLTNPGEDHRGLAALAAAALFEEGKGFRISCSYGLVLCPTEARDAIDVLRLADGRMYADKGEGRRVRQREEVTAVLAAVLRERHPGLDDHIDGVATWAVKVAERQGAGPAVIDEVRLGALLHDVGKMAVPDAIVDKPGPLDENEWAFMRRHPVIGARIVEAAPGLARVARVARWHHERWDGTGYPDKLAGEEIPFSARIVSVCDAFQAMIDDRPYRRGRPVAEAIAELRRCAGTQFDPSVVEAFIAVVTEDPKMIEPHRAVTAIGVG